MEYKADHIQKRMNDKMSKIEFRFQEFEIWQMATDLTDKLFNLAQQIEDKRHYRVALQLRAAIFNVTNNIAEGSGSFSNKEFINYLNHSRQSVFETANILLLLHKRDGISEKELENYLDDLDKLSKEITIFKRSLKQ